MNAPRAAGEAKYDRGTARILRAVSSAFRKSDALRRQLPTALSLHEPGCSGRGCDPRRCVLDVEKLISSVIERHIKGGTRHRDGQFGGGGGWLSRSDEEELVEYLLEAAWREYGRYEPKVPESRLAGFLVQRLHFRVTDFLRDKYGQTRNGPRPQTERFDIRLHNIATFDEYGFEENGRHLDRTELSERALEGLALLELAVETEQPFSNVAKELGMKNTHCVTVLRREAVVVDG